MAEQSAASTTAPAAVSGSTPAVTSGWLVKEGAQWKTWKKRWFILDEHNKLFYFTSKRDRPDDKYKGVITLDDATSAMPLEPETKGGRKHLFQIVTPSRTWYLAANSEEEKEAWLSTVRGILNKVNPPKAEVRRLVGPDDFLLLKLIGKGNFGKVMLVKLKATGEIFAMKMLSKKHIIENNEIEHTMAECNILQRLRHPFLINLHYAFSTADLYLILDFVNGGELFYHLQREKRFTELRVRFYAAEILLGLEHLHNAGVLYRDLKLENLLLTYDGHIVLTDFGLSKEGLIGTDARTGTFCGTPEYMAPEMLAAKGYGKQVDWWSFGSLVFEMLTGLPPFYAQDVQEMYRRIVSDRLTFPPYVSDTARGLICLLLEKDPAKRLSDPELIKRHPFFDGIDWDVLYRKKVTPPFVPAVKSNMDTSQIDPSFTQEPPSLDMSSMETGAPAAISLETGNSADPSLAKQFDNFTYVSPEHDPSAKQ